MTLDERRQDARKQPWKVWPPRSDFGPCSPLPCRCSRQERCDEARKMAAVNCGHCGHPIGYDDPFFKCRGQHGPAIHARCA